MTNVTDQIRRAPAWVWGLVSVFVVAAALGLFTLINSQAQTCEELAALDAEATSRAVANYGEAGYNDALMDSVNIQMTAEELGCDLG